MELSDGASMSDDDDDDDEAFDVKTKFAEPLTHHGCHFLIYRLL